ncbi:hypothetical protein SAMN05519104_0711 [Rhizobiales bacterium GAS188]|nr:hypothetical protein SAMN05519104_0711 [Rhizobiales bacterium GAS188]
MVSQSAAPARVEQERALAQPLSWPSLCLTLVALLALVELLAGWPLAASAGMLPLIAYLALTWRRLMINARILIGLCAGLAALTVLRADASAILAVATVRTIYLPAFIAMLGLLRAAASASAIVASAGRHLVNQPPRRRYLALSLGGQVFGILFNIGGLALLIDMTKRANTLEAAGGDPHIVDWRERRMTVAVLRGFGAIAFWSPLGVALNFLLASVPGLAWADVAPIGFLCMIAFIGLGWIFDHFQRPSALRPAQRAHEPRGTAAVTAVVAHIVAVTALTGAAEYALRLPFQTVLLVTVPLYAFFWALGSRLADGDRTPVRSGLAVILGRGVAHFPNYANEIAVFAASGFLGIVLAALVPREVLQAVFVSLTLSSGVIAGLLSVSVAVLALFGINPMITAAILASTMSSIEIPGLSKLVLVLAIATGWTCSAAASPMNSSVVMTAALIGRRPWQVGMAWSGAFAGTALAIAMVLFAVLVPR